jgi:antibiotic biosynthesis monooxygenase (ABM) superfamily enzyme
VIKVVVERHLRPGKEQDFSTLLVELWVKAMRRRGYVSGETLRSLEKPEVWLTISSWSGLTTWKNWEESRERQDILQDMEPMLRAPARESVFEPAFQR